MALASVIVIQARDNIRLPVEGLKGPIKELAKTTFHPSSLDYFVNLIC